MRHLNTLLGAIGISLLLALVAWGCSGVDDDEGQPAAARLVASDFQVTSPNFQERVRPYVRIPKKNTCYGDNVSPPLEWTEVPEGTRSFALVAEDADHHTGTWNQWVLYNIASDVRSLPEGISTSTDVLPDGTTQGTNDHRNIGYNGPCPPPVIKDIDPFVQSLKRSEPPHRYYFRLYALDTALGLSPGVTKAELVTAMEGHILAQADTMGKYTASVKVELRGSE